MHRLGSTVARLKLKGIDGDPHKRWIMRFNSMIRGEPYRGLTYNCKSPETGTPFEDCYTGVAWLPSARAVRCTVKSGNERNPYCMLNVHTRLPGQPGGRWGRRQISMTLTPRVTRMIQWPVQRVAKARAGANPRKPVSVQIAGCNSPA